MPHNQEREWKSLLHVATEEQVKSSRKPSHGSLPFPISGQSLLSQLLACSGLRCRSQGPCGRALRGGHGGSLRPASTWPGTGPRRLGTCLSCPERRGTGRGWASRAHLIVSGCGRRKTPPESPHRFFMNANKSLTYFQASLCQPGRQTSQFKSRARSSLRARILLPGMSGWRGA